MAEDNAALRDVLWKMYQEHCTQGRHHETQRSTVASALLAIGAAIIGIITLDGELTPSSRISSRGDNGENETAPHGLEAMKVGWLVPYFDEESLGIMTDEIAKALDILEAF